MQVPLLDLKAQYRVIKAEILKVAGEVFEPAIYPWATG